MPLRRLPHTGVRQAGRLLAAGVREGLAESPTRRLYLPLRWWPRRSQPPSASCAVWPQRWQGVTGCAGGVPMDRAAAALAEIPLPERFPLAAAARRGRFQSHGPPRSVCSLMRGPGARRSKPLAPCAALKSSASSRCIVHTRPVRNPSRARAPGTSPASACRASLRRSWSCLSIRQPLVRRTSRTGRAERPPDHQAYDRLERGETEI